MLEEEEEDHDHDNDDNDDDDHLCRILFEVVADLPNILLTIASRIGALAK